MDKFLNFYSKYPWVAVVIVAQWLAASFMIMTAQDINVTNVLGITFFATIVYAYFGFKVPKG